MMSYDNFTKKIQNAIDICSYPFFVVQQDKKKQCTCVEDSTMQPNPNCKKCLGTGYKVKMKIVKGASNEEMKTGGATMSAKTSRVIKNYYLKDDYDIEQDNYIIDNNELYYVYRKRHMKGIKNEFTHTEITASLHVNDYDIILKNCLEVINKNLPKKKRCDFPWLK